MDLSTHLSPTSIALISLLHRWDSLAIWIDQPISQAAFWYAEELSPL